MNSKECREGIGRGFEWRNGRRKQCDYFLSEKQKKNNANYGYNSKLLNLLGDAHPHKLLFMWLTLSVVTIRV